MMKRNEVEAVVLASSNTYTLSTLDEQTVLEHCFDKLIEVGVSEIVVVVGDNKNEIISYFEESYKNVPITYVHEVLNKGPAHSIKCAQSVITGDFLLVSGNVVHGTESFGKAVEAIQSPGIDGAVLVSEGTTIPYNTNTTYSTDCAGSIVGASQYSESDTDTSLIPTGFYVLPKGILSSCWEVNSSENCGNSIEEVIENYIHRGGRFDAVEFDTWSVEVNSEERLQKARQRVKENKKTEFRTVEVPTQD